MALMFSEDANARLNISPQDEGELLFEHELARVVGVRGNTLSTYECEHYFAATTGVVYFEGEGQGGAAKYVFDSYLAAVSPPYGHYFAIIYDKKLRKIISFGDYNSGRKVFYFEGENIRGVSSKLKKLVDCGFVEKAQNLEYKQFALIYGYHPKKQTIYQGIYRTEKKDILKLDAEGVKITQFSDRVGLKGAENDSIGTVKEKLYNRLLEVTESCLQGEDKTAVLLGGFDSALMASLAKKVGREVKGYTFQYQSGEHNQKNVSEVVASVGMDHEWVDIDSNVIKSGLLEYSNIFDRPTNWPNYVIQTNYLLRRISEDDYKICLTGDGCDEAFLGYPGIYRGAKLFSKEMPNIGWLLKLLRSITEIEYAERKLGHVYRLVRRIIVNLTLEKKVRLYFMFRIMDETTINSLFGAGIKPTRERVMRIVSELSSEVDRHTDTIVAYEGRENIIPNRLKISGAMDASDVKIYSPFMHPDVRSYVRTIPEKLLRPGSEAKRDSLGKKILLDMAVEKGLLPYKVVYQPKHAAVDGPLDMWYDREIRDTLKDLISGVGDVRSESFLDDMISEKAIEIFYKKKFSVDSISGHAVSLLATYGSYFK